MAEGPEEGHRTRVSCVEEFGGRFDEIYNYVLKWGKHKYSGKRSLHSHGLDGD